MSKRGENITKRKDGRWEARVIRGYDCSGKALYHYIYGKTYSEAKNKKNEYLAGQLKKTNKNDHVLFSSVLSDFLIYQQNKVKTSTLARYRDIINLHIMPTFGNMQIREMNSQMIELFTNQKIENGRLDGNGGLSPKRVRDILSVIKLVFAYAQDQGYISQIIKFSMPRLDKPHVEIFSKDDEMRLISYSISNLEPSKCGVIISLCTGIRIGELCALQWSDIDTESNIITINKTLQRIPNLKTNNKTKVIIESPKSKASERQIPIPALLHEQLESIKPQTNSPNYYVLTSSEKYIEPSNYYVKYQHWLNECGIENHSFHALRHTFATRAIECGMDVKSLSEILGHSDVKVTLARYVHPSMEQKSINMEKMNVYIRSQLVRHC